MDHLIPYDPGELIRCFFTSEMLVGGVTVRR